MTIDCPEARVETGSPGRDGLVLVQVSDDLAWSRVVMVEVVRTGHILDLI